MCFGKVALMGKANSESVQHAAGKFTTGAMRGMSRTRKMAKLGREEMNVRCDIHKLMCNF